MTAATNTNAFAGGAWRPAGGVLWAAQAFSLLGRWVHGFALSWHVYQTTGSAFWLGLVAALSSLPVLALSPVAGAVVDRCSLRRVLLATQGLLVLLAAATAVLATASCLRGPALLGLSLAFGAVNGFDAPAFQAWLVEETGEGGLDRTIARQSFAINGSKIAAPFLASGLVLCLGTSSCFLLNALSYLPLALVVLASRDRGGRPPPLTGPLPAGDGRAAPPSPASALLLVGGFAFLGLPCISLMPSIAGEVLGGGLRSFSAVMTGVAAGGFVASAVFWLDASRTRRHALIPWSALAYAGGVLALFAPVGPFGHCVIAAVVGAALCVFLTLCNHCLQAGLSNCGRGRVTSLHAGAVLGLPALGTLVLGGLGDAFGMRAALVADCALLAALAAALIASPQMRTAGGRRTGAGRSAHR